MQRRPFAGVSINLFDWGGANFMYRFKVTTKVSGALCREKMSTVCNRGDAGKYAACHPNTAEFEGAGNG